MFFSAKEMLAAAQRGRISSQNILNLASRGGYKVSNVQSVTQKHCQAALKYVRDQLTNRDGRAAYSGNHGIGKWYRPYVVVDKLADRQAPQGDYYIGVEVEFGFQSHASASVLARRLRNWKYVTIDAEGGPYGMEVSFVPVLYSKLNSRSQVFRYVQMLKSNENLLVPHQHSSSIGTHVCISGHGYDVERMDQRVEWINLAIQAMSHDIEACILYFGRRPYGLGYVRSKFVEWKLFNSTTDTEALRRYIEVAKALYALAESTEVINLTVVRSHMDRALEIAARKNARSRKTEVVQVASDAAADENFAVAA